MNPLEEFRHALKRYDLITSLSSVVGPSPSSSDRSNLFLQDLIRAAALLQSTPLPPVAVEDDTISGAELSRMSDQFESLRGSAVLAAREKFEAHRQRYPSSPLFNRFTYLSPVDWGSREVAVTRMLAWFLDTSREHLFGTAILRSLLESLGPGDADWATVQGVVSAEHHLSSGSRIDIYGSGTVTSNSGAKKRWQLGIEAKIDSEESAGQTKRYGDLMLRFPSDLRYAVFLTPDGASPELSEGGPYVDLILPWKGMSYTQLAAILLKHSIGEPGVEQSPYVILSLFISCLIRDIQGYFLPLNESSWLHSPYGTLKLLRELDNL